MIGMGKEHRTATSTRPTMGLLTPRKVTIQRNLVIDVVDSNDDYSLAKHDARVDLNPSGARIRYTQESALMVESPPASPLPYLVKGQRTSTEYGKVLVPNPDYKGKAHTESASSAPAPRVARHRRPAAIRGPPGIMEDSDEDDTREEKEEPSSELVAALRHKITALEEQVAELHLAVYDQNDDFGVLRKATTSKLKRFSKALGLDCAIRLFIYFPFNYNFPFHPNK